MNVEKAIDFFRLAERLECEYRVTRMSDGTRQSVASHSWNMAMMAMVLFPYLQIPVNRERVLELCLIHDLHEAADHDIPLHQQTPAVRAKKHAAEIQTINKIVDMLDGDTHMRALFDEYDARQSPESRLVKALDGLDAMLSHLCTPDLGYLCECENGFYWKLFFSDEFASGFDFEPALRQIADEIRTRASMRLWHEKNIDADICYRGDKK